MHEKMDQVSPWRWLRMIFFGVLASLMAATAQAQAVAAESEYLGATRQWLDQAVSGIQSSGATPLRMARTPFSPIVALSASVVTTPGLMV